MRRWGLSLTVLLVALAGCESYRDFWADVEPDCVSKDRTTAGGEVVTETTCRPPDQAETMTSTTR
jgi:hypothetical protein